MSNNIRARVFDVRTKFQEKMDRSHGKMDKYTYENRFPKMHQLVNAIIAVIQSGKHCVVIAPVKSGKRIGKIGCTMATHKNARKGKTCESSYAHIYVSSLNRTDEAEQKEELRDYGFEEIHQFGKPGAEGSNQREKYRKVVDDAINNVMNIRNGNDKTPGREVIVHFNESDYGTDRSQLFHEFHEKLHGIKGIHFVYWSATNEEIIGTHFCKKYCEILRFEPEDNYRGAKWYLDKGLVTDATPFWDCAKEQLTAQGRKAMKMFQDSDKYYSVVRFANNYKDIVNSPAFHKAIAKYGVKVKKVDGENRFNWGAVDSNQWSDYANGGKHLIVLAQTATRSTEIKILPLIAFWHDYRNSATYATDAQACLRVVHYYDGIFDNRIQLFCTKATVQFAAGLIDETTWRDYASKGRSVDRSLSTRMRYVKEKGPRASMVYDSRPSENELINQYESFCRQHNIEAVHPPKGEKFSKMLVCSSNAEDIAKAALDESIRSSLSAEQPCMIYHLDAPHRLHEKSWGKLPSSHRGKYVAVFLIPSKDNNGEFVTTFHSSYAGFSDN